MQDAPVQPLGQKDPLEEDITIHFSIPAWKIPTEEPGGLQSTGSQKSWSRLRVHTCNADSAKTSTTVHAVSEQMEISHNTTVRSHLARPLKFMLIERQIQKSGNSIRNRPIGIHRERWERGGREEGAGGGDRETEREINWLHVCFRDTAGSVPDHCHKANITTKQITQIFWLPSAYKSYVVMFILSYRLLSMQ